MRPTLAAVFVVGAMSLDWTSGPTTDLECARSTIAECERTAEPYACTFGELPDAAIKLACASKPQALACVIWRDSQ